MPKKIHEILGYYAITKQVLDDAKLTQKRAKRVKQQSLNFFSISNVRGLSKKFVDIRDFVVLNEFIYTFCIPKYSS